jgi:glucose/arabinose dehydrogenase
MNTARCMILLVCASGPGIAGTAEYSAATGFGPAPRLPEPESSLIPTVNIAPVAGWSEGEAPVAAPGLAVSAFATGLEHPRWLHVLPNGDVLVAETNAPERPDQRKGIKGWAMKLVMKRAGAATPSANRISLLRDADGDGAAELRSPFLESLNSPFGMWLAGEQLYVANTDALLRYAYVQGAVRLDDRGALVAELPAGTINHHWTKNVIATPDGRKLYVTVGSNSNVGERGMEHEERRAAILEIDAASGASRVFASGLRNPNGMDWHPDTGVLWTVVNERDEIGDDLVPDYMTAVHEGAFYGWPYSYFGEHVDERVRPQDPALVESATYPDYALGSHTASLGLVFYRGELFPRDYAGGAFIGQHGSWNRKAPSGYAVIFVPFKGGRPAGMPRDVLTGFLDDEGRARGRPAAVAIDRAGALLVADDVGNVVWRVTPVAHSGEAT